MVIESEGTYILMENVVEFPIRLSLILENRLLGDSLKRLLRRRSDFLSIRASTPEASSLRDVLETECDVVILDFLDARWLPANLEAKGTNVPPKFLLVGMEDNTDQFLQAIRGGVCGYLLHNASISDLVAAVRTTSRGEAVCPPKLCAWLFQIVVSTTGLANTCSSRPNLTVRQQRLAALVAAGLTNKEIATYF